MLKKFLVIYFFLITPSIFGKISGFRIIGSKTKEFSYQDACKTMKADFIPIVQAINTSWLDCMGKRIQATSFCVKKLSSETNVLRGFINANSKKVICQMGEKAQLAVSCIGKYKKYCVDSKNTCGKLQNVFARQLNLSHHSIIKERQLSGTSKLRCYFSSTPKISIKKKTFRFGQELDSALKRELEAIRKEDQLYFQKKKSYSKISI